MSVLENHPPTPSPHSGRPPEERLDSWKAIAVYLGRGVRTVQRWERDEGLPVHRLAHEKRGSVYAQKQEVDAWWESRRLTLSNDSSPANVEPPPSPVPERLTWMSAATFWPALSSDGRLLAFVSDAGRDGALPQIWLHQIGGSTACLTSGSCERSHLTFSPDDTRLVFTASDDTGQNVYAMPTLGGERRLLKRAARAGRLSPDGRWMAYVALDEPAGVRIAAVDGTSDRTVAPSLVDVSFAIWSPDSRHLLVHGHADPSSETDYWIISVDGSAVVNTGIGQRLRERGMWLLTQPAAWVTDALVFCLITPTGVTVWRQRLDPRTLQPSSEPERLTSGNEFDGFPTAAGDRVAFVNAHADQNLWAVPIDPVSGMARGSLRRLTRGPGFVAHLSVSRDGRTLSYFFARHGSLGLMIRDLEAGSEAPFRPEPPMDYGFPTISPSGGQLAFSARLQGPRAMRPIFVAKLADGTCRKLGDDFGGRPLQWVDERFLVVERFGGRLHSIALLDTTSAHDDTILSSAEQSITNPHVSPDARWIAFDAARPGGPPSVFVARLHGRALIPQDEWIAVERAASHPFWSADGSRIYYLPTIPSSELRNVVRARRFEGDPEMRLGESITAFVSAEMVVPAFISFTAPVATHDQIIFVLGDFRGDVWMMDLSTPSARIPRA